MEKEAVKIFENITKSVELVLEHYKSRGFKNSLIEVGLRNIISLAKEGIDLIGQTIRMSQHNALSMRWKASRRLALTIILFQYFLKFPFSFRNLRKNRRDWQNKADDQEQSGNGMFKENEGVSIKQ